MKIHLQSYTSSSDPVQMLLNMAADQGLHCSLTGISMQNKGSENIHQKTPRLQMDSSKG